jgi:hypothetical protein
VNKKFIDRVIKSDRFQVVFTVLILNLLLWLVRYWYSGQFGLYEDDITNIPGAIVMGGRELLEYNLVFLGNLYGNGHPLHFVFIRVLSWIGWRLGGLQAIYLFGFVTVASSVTLFYLLIRRIWNQELAILTGVFFVLYSADTTQAFLTHAIGLYSAMVLLLLGFHLYLSEKKTLAYISATLALLTYETAFLVFIAAPLLLVCMDRRLTIRMVVKHALIVGSILLAFVLIRLGIGDGRIQDLQGAAIFLTPIRHMIIGPIVSLGSYFIRAYQVLSDLQTGELVPLIMLIPVMMLLLKSLRFDPKPTDARNGSDARTLDEKVSSRLLPMADSLRKWWVDLEPEDRKLLALIFAAVLMIVVAYPLTYTTRSYTLSGRGTRVHFAAAPGVAIFYGTGIYLLLSRFLVDRRRWVGIAFLSLIFSLQVIFGVRIQRDYVVAWERETIFWGELLPLIDDADSEEVVLVDPQVFEDVGQIGANTWNLPSVLWQLIEFPEPWYRAPTVYRLLGGWQRGLVSGNGEFKLDNYSVTAPGSYYRNVSPSQTIFINHDDAGNLQRQDSITIDSMTYKLKSRTDRSFLAAYDKRILFEIMDLRIVE